MGKNSRLRQGGSKSEIDMHERAKTPKAPNTWKGVVCYAVPAEDLLDASKQDISLKQIRKVNCQMLNREFQSAQIEFLNGSKAMCCRASGSDRVLYGAISLDHQAYLVLVEYIFNHDYAGATFQDDERKIKAVITALQSNYTENPTKFMAEQVVTLEQLQAITKEEIVDDNMDEHEIKLLTHYRGKFIELDLTQDEMVMSELPAIVTGAAGSGKSCVAFSKLRQHCGWGNKLYITSSKPLADDMRLNWSQSLSVSGDHAGVEFVDYETFIKGKHADELNEKEMVDKEYFEQWYKMKWKKEIKLDAKIVYQEFQFLLMCRLKDDFVSQGKKISQVLDSNIKEKVYECFGDYIEHLMRSNKVDLRFYKLKAVKAEFDLVMVDESQDFSAWQLENLVGLAFGHQHCFFLDTNQSDYVVSVRSYLANLLSEQIKRSVTQYTLTFSYRNSRAVARLASACQKLKNAVVRGKGDREEYIEIQLSPTVNDEGYTKWVDVSNQAEMAMLKQFMQENRADCAVVVNGENNKKSAERHFGTPLIFTIKETKGLEFPHVILYHLMQDGIFNEINDQIEGEVSDIRRYDNLPKTTDNVRFMEPLKDLFVAITRAKQSCYFLEQKSRKQGKIQSFFQSEMSGTSTTVEMPVMGIRPSEGVKEKASLNEAIDKWRTRALQLIDASLFSQAIRVIEEELGLFIEKSVKEMPTREQLQSVLDGQSASNEVSDAAIETKKISLPEKKRKNGRLKKSNQEKNETKIITLKDVSKAQFIQMVLDNPPGMLKSLVSLDKQDFADLMCDDFNKSPSIMHSVLQLKGLEVLWKAADEDAAAELFNCFISSTNGRFLLFNFIHENEFDYKSITKKMLFYVGPDKKMSLTHFFEVEFDTSRELVEKYVDLFCLDDNAIREFCRSFECGDGYIGNRQSVLTYLLELLESDDSFNRFVELNKDKKFALDAAQKKNGPLRLNFHGRIVLKEISAYLMLVLSSKPACYVLVKKIFDDNPDLYQQVTRNHLVSFDLNMRDGDFKILFMLTKSNQGINLFDQIIKRNKILRDSFYTEDLFLKVSSTDPSVVSAQYQGSCVFRELLVQGRSDVLYYLLQNNVKLIKHITTYHLNQSGGGLNVSILVYILASKHRDEFLLLFKIHNPLLYGYISANLSITHAKAERMIGDATYVEKFFDDIPGNVSELISCKEKTFKRLFACTKASSGKTLKESLEERGWESLWRYPDGRVNKKTFYLLFNTKNGIEIIRRFKLNQVKIDNPDLARKLFFTPGHLMMGDGSSNKRLPTVFQILSRPELFAGFIYLILPESVLCSNETVAHLFDRWPARVNNDSANVETMTWAFLDLASTEAGSVVLSRIFKDNDSLAQHITPYELYKAERAVDSPFISLTKSTIGIEFIIHLFSKRGSFLTKLPLDDLFINYQSSADRSRCPFDNLFYSERGGDLFSLLLMQDRSYSSKLIELMRNHDKEHYIEDWIAFANSFEVKIEGSQFRLFSAQNHGEQQVIAPHDLEAPNELKPASP